MSNVKLIYKRIYFDGGAQSFLLLLLLCQLFFQNGIYLFGGLACLALVVYQLQHPLKPSVFSIILIYHLVQVMAGVWLSNFMDKDINFRSLSSATATFVSYIGLIVMFIPIIYYQNKIPHLSIANLAEHANRLSIKKTFNAYIIAFFATNLLGGIAFLIPGLAQVIISFVKIKWLFFLLFGFQALLKKTMQKQFYFFIAFEFLLGFFSFFSDFKTVIFFVSFMALTFLRKVYLQQVISVSLAIIPLFYLAVMWTNIKGEYRAFLNQGSKAQTVQVGREDALNKLVDLSNNQKEGGFNDAAAELFARLQYTYHLAKTMDRVPAIIPHENGGNIARILEFVFTLRIINPDKPKYEASVKARRYTGINYLGASHGVSFSLGYFADCYIDFGYFGMMFPLFILGIVFGGSYFYFVRKSSNNFIFNYSVVGAMFMEFHAFEMDGTFLLGRLYATLVTFFVLKIFFFPMIMNYLKPNPATRA